MELVVSLVVTLAVLAYAGWREKEMARERTDLVDRLLAKSPEEYKAWVLEREIAASESKMSSPKKISVARAEEAEKLKNPTVNDVFIRQRAERVSQGRPGVF